MNRLLYPFGHTQATGIEVKHKEIDFLGGGVNSKFGVRGKRENIFLQSLPKSSNKNIKRVKEEGTSIDNLL